MSVPNNLDVPLPRIHPERGLLDSALWCGEAGLPVFPLWRNGKTPNTDLVGTGWKTAEIGTTDPEKLRAYWTAEPFSNIGMPLGPYATGTAAWDLDYRKGQRPRTQLEQRCRELGVEFPRGPRVRSASGEHVHVALPEGVHRLPKRTNYIVDAVDFISNGGYIVLPPSRLARRTYESALRKPGDPPPLPRKLTEANRATEKPDFLTYRWVRPDMPDPTDVEVFGGEEVAATSPVPELDDDEWSPTPRQLWTALADAVLDAELIADILTRPVAVSRSGGRVRLSANGLPHWEDGVPVEEWCERGLPRDMHHEPCVKQAANHLAARGLTVEEITAVLERITDPAVTPLKRPGEPWRRGQLERKAEESVDWIKAERARERALTELMTKTIEGWTP